MYKKYNAKEETVVISQEKLNQIESEYGCGYYHLCWGKACPCAITTENKGLTKKYTVVLSKKTADCLKYLTMKITNSNSHFDYNRQ